MQGTRDGFSPELTPDGTTLLYLDRPADWAEPQPVRVMRIALPGGPAQPVLEASGIAGWAMRMGCPRRAGLPCVLAQQQGSEIVFRAFDPEKGFTPSGDEIARIPVDPNHQTPWGISPDGSQLAYARWNASEGRIHVLPLEANAGRLMVREPEHEVRAAGCSRIHKIGWRADGRGWFVTTEAAAAGRSIPCRRMDARRFYCMV